MTSDEICRHIRDHWVQNIGADELEAALRAERGFWHMLQTGAIREWGFNEHGDTLYEPQSSVSEAIVYVLLKKEE